MAPEQIEIALEKILPRVSKPGRYTGGEYNQVVKDWDAIDFKVCTAFPDIYDLGMSNLGLMILYNMINDWENLLCERTYSVWDDMEDKMREVDLPLFSLETKHSIRDFDMIALSLPYEQLYTNALNMIDLAGMPVRSEDRDASYPLIVAGGHATYNPEPMAPFIDVFVIGEAEDAIMKIISTMMSAKGMDRETQLRYLAMIEGVYVPRFYDVAYNDDGTVQAITSNMPEAPKRVMKTIAPVLPPPVTKFVVPYIETVHTRAPVEIMRGCTRGCRFCHAGMITRPVRERPVQEILDAMDAILENTGYEEIALLSLSSSDYTHVLELTRKIGERFGHLGLNVSLPSLRTESVSTELMDNLGDSKRGGFTLAPEAATEKMRNIINKYVTDEELKETADAIYSRDWRTIKLYFMIGHPQENLEDVRAIAELCKDVVGIGRRYHGKKAAVNAGVSTFIPKPHTPFQWEPMDSVENVIQKQMLLKDRMKMTGLRLRWNDPLESVYEGFLSRGDRRIANVLERAWRKGAKFDAWGEFFDMSIWEEAFEEEGLDIPFYVYRRRAINEVFPWEHIDVAITRKFLTEDYLMSQTLETRVDCRDQCFACGILPKLKEMRRETADDAWLCPPVKKRKNHKPREVVMPDTSIALPMVG
ncbi:MAG: radical SAM family uncharacterized protein, partial [Candidatus Promineifilaceae bacterium]|jgi:radical SAM family uncharacterized protein